LCQVLSLSTTHTPWCSTISLHDALPILHVWAGPIRRGKDLSYVLQQLRRCCREQFSDGFSGQGTDLAGRRAQARTPILSLGRCRGVDLRDRKSTRLNSSHVSISYAVFC